MKFRGKAKTRLYLTLALAAALTVITTVYVSHNSNTNAAGNLEITSISPETGPTTGYTWLTIRGEGFPDKVRTSDYVPDGLVALYDAKNNVGLGDENHAENTDIWKDLSPSGADLTLYSGDNTFLEDGFVIKGIDNYWSTPYFANLPTGNSSFSVEMRYTFVGSFEVGTFCTISWGSASNSRSNCTGFRGPNYLTHAFWANDINIGFPNAHSTPNTLTITYEAGTGVEYQKTARKAYGNANPLNYNSYGGSELWADPDTAPDKCLYVGAYPNAAGCAGSTNANIYNNQNMKIQSVRIYNKALTQTEIDNNFEVDNNRFINPPVVTVGGQPCTNLVVISANEIRCRTPAMDSDTQFVNTPYDVELTYDGETKTATQKFTYKNFTLSSISPNRGPVKGGNVVSIFGENFPYVSTEDYVQDGLIVQYDGIDNTGQGDKFHSNTTTTWRDLTGHGYDGVLENYSNPTWRKTGGLIFDGSNDAVALPEALNDIYGHDVTVDIFFVAYAKGDRDILFGNYGNADSWAIANVNIERNSSSSVPPGSTRFWWHNGQVDFALTNTITDADTGYLLTISVDKTLGKLKAYSHGTLTDEKAASGLKLSPAITPGTYFRLGRDNRIGGTAFKGTIYGFRVYDRVLSDAEVQLNANVDRLRYAALPSVTIGGADCTNVAVISSTELQCVAPAGTAGVQDVVVTRDTYPQTLSGVNGYTYVDNSDDFYVFSQSINHGNAGDTITFTGNKLDQVSAIEIGGNDCAILDSPAPTNSSISCTVPPETDYTNNTKNIEFTVSGFDPLTLEQAWTYDNFISLISPASSSVNLNVTPNSANETTNSLIYGVNSNYHNGYKFTIQTDNTDADYIGHPNDLLCKTTTNGNYYFEALTEPTLTLPANKWSYKLNTDPNWRTPNQTAQTLWTTEGPTTYDNPDQLNITFGAKADTRTPACTYTGTIMVTVVGDV